MAERKTQIMSPDGQRRDGFEVPIVDSSEKWSEYQLEDGTVVRGRLTVLSAIRIADMYDEEGNPMYMFKSNNMFTVVEAPDGLRRKVQ